MIESMLQIRFSTAQCSSSRLQAKKRDRYDTDQYLLVAHLQTHRIGISGQAWGNSYIQCKDSDVNLADRVASKREPEKKEDYQ